MLPINPAVAGGPQTPSCGTYKVLKNETIAGQAFPKGSYILHAICIPCDKVIDKKGLFAQFLSLPDKATLPQPYIFWMAQLVPQSFQRDQASAFALSEYRPNFAAVAKHWPTQTSCG